ncbi:hypothetical protein C2W62_10665 [Candidatus Entotheonella serta]|nr:hypothetical protein C2W62_10665 [Candidatus Entotheonella serta]
MSLRIPVYAGETEQGAIEEPHDSIQYYFRRQADIQRAGVGWAGAGPADRRQARADRLANLTHDEILHTKVAFGTARNLVDRLSQLQEELGLDGIVAELDAGGLIPAERVKRSLHILTHDVMLHVK